MSASDRFSPAEEGGADADFLRAILLFIWGIIRLAIFLVLAFLEPFVRFVHVGVSIVSLLAGLVYKASSVTPPIPFWVTLCVSLGCLCSFRSIISCFACFRDGDSSVEMIGNFVLEEFMSFTVESVRAAGLVMQTRPRSVCLDWSSCLTIRR